THSRSSLRTATTISPTRSEAMNFRTVWIRIGEPSSSMNCLRLVPACAAELFPIRVPKPAAGSMTATFMRLRFYRGFLGGRDVGDGLRLALPHRTIVPFGAGDRVGALVEASEDHFAGGSLEHTGDGNIDGLRDHPLGIVYHHHGAVVEIGDALVVLL